VLCPPNHPSDLWGNITVQNNPTSCYFEWVSNDHTLADGSGSMLVVDFPDFNPNGTSNFMDIWSSTVSVEPGETYCFGAWFMNLNTNPRKSKPNFRYMVNDSLIGVSPELTVSGIWEYYAFTYTVPSGDSMLTIALENGKFGGNGNDLAIDDIEFAKLGAGLLPPTANNDEVVILPTAVNVPINVLANDHPNNPAEAIDTSSLTLTTLPAISKGSATVNQWGEVVFTPTAGFLGTVSFKYQICQSSGCCDEAIVIVNIDNILPVELEDLSVEWMGDRALLNWRTANETNNSHFVVERSLDNQLFQSIGNVEGAGTTLHSQAYQFQDTKVQKLPTDKIYYRLKQVDLDGTIAVSPTMVLSVSTDDVLRMKVYPNPADKTQTIFLDYTNETGEDIKLEVLNLNGQIVHQQIISGILAPNDLRLELGHLTNGLYMVKLSSEYLHASQRLILHD
jgi:hypothetical protein